MENNATFTTHPNGGLKNTPRRQTEEEEDKEDRISAINKRKKIQFQASHTLLIAFFFWIFSLHALGIYFFTKGFLLTRLVLDSHSKCASSPIEFEQQGLRNSSSGCWHPKTFDKAVIIIIDALRYDFTVPVGSEHHHYHNALKVLYETAVEQPHNAFLLPFIADPPTATLQRLKGLTTGTLPTFVEFGSNFAGTAIEEDNLLRQLRAAGKNLVHLGDDTWHSLFPGYFDDNLTHAYDSFNVWDLHTVDNGVTEHIIPLLHHEEVEKWDVIIGHYLGVDHAGHRYGPDHPAMANKLHEMDVVLREIIALLDEQTLLVVMGDHGMDAKGDHGGESDDEIEAALWMYSKKSAFGRLNNDSITPPNNAKERPTAQIDLVPTLSLLLGLPIPYNNLGSPIAEAFVGTDQPDWKNLMTVNAISSGQISDYQRSYSLARGLDDGVFRSSNILREKAFRYWFNAVASNVLEKEFKVVFEMFTAYQKDTLRLYRSLWARFDVTSMVEGIAILFVAACVLAFYARSAALHGVEYIPVYLLQTGKYSVAGAILAGTVKIVDPSLVFMDSVLLGLGLGGVLGFGVAVTMTRAALKYDDLPIPSSVWGWLSVIFTLLQAIGFASNSYTIWEDEILLCFLSTFGVVALVSSFRQNSASVRSAGIAQSVLFLVLARISSLSRLCREEQMPHCKSTYYASSNSSTSAPWQLLIPLFLAITLPMIIKLYYVQTLSYKGPAVLWIGFTLRLGLLATAAFWILDAADDNDWFGDRKSIIRAFKMILARLTLGLAFVAGTTYYLWAKPCVSIEVSSRRNGADAPHDPPKKRITVVGYMNMHGSRYFLLVCNWIIALILVQKPMGAGAIGALVVQILALLEIADANNISQSAIGPVILGALGSFHFFKTGHQATLASIQWESAFIPLQTIIYPWSPMLVILNSFGAQILTTVAVPLLATWKQPPKSRGLLGSIAKAMATFILYHAIINLATTVWAAWLRRHLMLYRIFSPRFMTGATVLLLLDLIGILVAIGGVRSNFISVAEVFGW
ncbi:MAG: mannose-ethanolamine phosphotransferase gpi13 [Heterodermia speciosa]|uniref:Mannose-ethanolamine phosphotransferase gpi13 n=1 Tax=Heterodermia speciosa TaxID=116794 RepID=A0A8H3ETW1_9LECA|nr:MAG: mannose-ethanolamine phosphotransferase gpi13 [Heterodermia speciosa]